ncbi:MAG: GNAT family N-acetyltransferase [Pirellulaceae bacterium]|nr:GNAT family N-acetyltransferase [Pirellulaceae bacterium]
MSGLPRLENERLVLRPFDLEDAVEVQCLAGDLDIASTTVLVPHPYLDGMAEEWIVTHHAAFVDRRILELAIELRATAELVGAISLTLNMRDACAELGYWVGKPYWGNGYCTEAARLIIEFGFHELKLNRVFAKHMTRNPSSGRVLEKLGMQYEGCLRQHVQKWNQFEDMNVYGLLCQTK